MTSDDIRQALPAEPSRQSGRRYMLWVMLFAAAQAGGIMATGYAYWPALAVIDAMVIGALLIARSATTLDLNKWMDSARRMVEAKYGAGR